MRSLVVVLLALLGCSSSSATSTDAATDALDADAELPCKDFGSAGACCESTNEGNPQCALTTTPWVCSGPNARTAIAAEGCSDARETDGGVSLSVMCCPR